MIKQYCSNNVVSTSDTENTIPNSLLITYGNKSIELNIMKDLFNTYQNSILEKEKILQQEKQKLDEINCQVLSLKDAFCNQVWQFSRKHDFSSIFKYYPLIGTSKHWTEQRNNYKNGIDMNLKLIDLIKEINVIKMEIHNFNHGKILKEDIERALTSLEKLQLISNDATELLRLISFSEPSCVLGTISMPIYDEIISSNDNKIKRRKNDSNYDLNNKKIRSNQRESSIKNKSCLKNDKINSMSNQKKITTTSKNYPQLLLEKNVIFTTETEITDVSLKSTNKKKLNFSLKKRSEISIKFEQYRQYK